MTTRGRLPDVRDREQHFQDFPGHAIERQQAAEDDRRREDEQDGGGDPRQHRADHVFSPSSVSYHRRRIASPDSRSTVP